MRITLGLFLALFLFMANYAYGQWVEPSAADLEGAWEVNVNQTYNFERSPIGFGNVKEFTKTKKNTQLIFFKEERNTVWTTFEIPYDGVLLFDIVPYQLDDDYDWMLFTKTDSLAKELLNRKAIPIRANNSRNNKQIGARTGIKQGFENQYEKPGPGQSYSKPLPVKEGERYYLIVDNIYEEGKGFDIKLEIAPSAEFNDSTYIYGRVIDKQTRKALTATLSLEDDSTAYQFNQIRTDSLGRYKMKVPLYRPLNLTAVASKHLFSTEDFEIERSPDSLKIDFELDSVGRDKSVNLFNIHFGANSADIKSSSYPDLDRMLQFLIENQEWKIKIIGHSNNNVWANQTYLQNLSMKRAVAVKTYFIQNGVDEYRLSCLGMGGKKPLVKSDDQKIASKNLRVEIQIQPIISNKKK